MSKLVIAEGYPLIAGCLRQIVAVSTDIELVAEVNNGRELIDTVRRTPVDVLLLDMSLPGANGLDLIRRIHIEIPHLPVCAMTLCENARVFAMPALRAGAAGFVTKYSTCDVLLEAIRKLARGERFLDMMAVNDIMLDLDADRGPIGRELSPREIQVLQMLTDGKPTSEIADILNVSAKTISTHRTRLYQKLHVSSVAELVRYAVEHKMIAA